MRLTQAQIEEVQKAYTELLAECGGTFAGCQIGLATHDVTHEFALVVQCTYVRDEVDTDWEGHRVLKHSTDADSEALWEFICSIGSADENTILVSEADLQGRDEISVSELLEMAAKRRPA